ncbi:LTA synthase family protein [Chryseobacterium sp. SNU WT5]|uniref:LTA synthase family protein n=1 Tax=Chryseobacterium sp. SNU WT5 TaxID=2594269 RepID=UPI001627CFDF|nr:alkaline phosphatase family protein [Chryseobacterium sp. SNU WT5]
MSDLARALMMGVRFDMVISCYILALPTLIFLIFYIFKRKNLLVNRILYFYCAILYTIAFLISAVDIPYFNQFFSRLDKGIFQWIENPAFITEMIAKDFKLWGFVFPFLILLFIFQYFLKKIFILINKLEISRLNFVPRIILSFFILGITFVGIRGRIEAKSPIRVGTAYFSENAFLNKIGLNPNFTFIHSLLQKSVTWSDLMDDRRAFSIVQEQMNIKVQHDKFSLKHPISLASENLGKPNIVLVLMESMTADNMKYFGNTKNLTPVLDDLITKSIFFENTYSEGIHTFNGIYGTLTSFPALWNQHPMKSIQNYTTFTTPLKKAGYENVFFTTHDSQFDNMEGFLYANDFQKVYSQKDYPSSEVKSNLGVSDDYLFRFGIEKINEMQQKRKAPFFTSFLTSSNHSPIIIPDYFKSNNPSQEEKVIQYADWSIGQFLKEAEKQSWYKNTIFVFLADHGSGYERTYEMSLSYNHIPLFFYAPHLLKNTGIRKDFVKQIDVIPSIMGLTDISYIKNNLGINVWTQKREFAYFGADDKIGVVNQDYFLIYRKDGHEALYNYRTKDLKNYVKEYPVLVQKMKEYAFSNLQVAHSIKKKLK